MLRVGHIAKKGGSKEFWGLLKSYKKAYNELGELIEKNLHSEDNGSTFAQSIDYRYNIRGWLISINNAQLTNTTENNDTGQATDYWGMELGYNNALTGVTATATYNGNISAVKWSDKLGQDQRAYAYQYDPMNRLVDAYHSTLGQANANAFDVTIGTVAAPGYDLNGNIETLNRYGKAGIIDQLTYTYGDQGNQLQYVEDPTVEAEGFINGHSGSTADPDYAYDDNGNLTQDFNKGIIDITYNHLNLPETVEKADGQSIKYTYDASGVKLQQIVGEGDLSQPDFSMGIPEDWILSKLTLANAGSIGGESDVHSLISHSSNGYHQLYKAVDVGKRVKIKVDVYIPSSNPHVNGVQLYIGSYSENHVLTTDQWHTLTFDHIANSSFIKLVLTQDGSYQYSGTSDLIYFKNLEYTVYEEKTTDYVGEFIYENDRVALIQHEEGRIVPNAATSAWAYEYYLKDHLGNTRVTFTTNPKEIEFTLNYESNPAVPDDIALFEEVAPANTISNDLFDHTDETGTTYTHTQLLTGGLNAQVGSVIAIPVGMGDTLHAEVFAKYKDNTGNGNNSGAAIAGLLINAFTGGTGMTNELGNQSINNNFGSGSLIGTTGFAPEDANAPMAFLNVMFLPEDETIDLEKDVSFAYDQIDGTAMQPTTSTKAAHDRMHIDNFVAPDKGYVLVYLSNESTVMTEVYFDDLKITVNEHPVIQADSYYPFGLTFDSYQRITAKENKYLNTGKERITDLDLNWDDFGARMYMPDIGRWGVNDPAADKYSDLSPYNYTFNNPLRFIDPDGEDPIEVINKASSYLGTPYEWGGKNPDPRTVGFINQNSSDFDYRWASSASFQLRDVYDKDDPQPTLETRDFLGVDSGCSFGIDCSGLVSSAFNADSDKLMDDLVGGSANDQMGQFARASEEGTGILHNNTDNVGTGDILFKTNKKGNAFHTMVATGNVKTNKKGKVTRIEVVEAPASGKFVKKSYVKAGKRLKVGHTFRKGDNVSSNDSYQKQKTHFEAFKKEFQNQIN
ncbi:MAG: RHS repeat-associated core domain-containing protein [Bacteroidota bacterium]